MHRLQASKGGSVLLVRLHQQDLQLPLGPLAAAHQMPSPANAQPKCQKVSLMLQLAASRALPLAGSAMQAVPV